MSEMWKPFLCDSTSIASDTLCGSSVGPMVTRGTMLDMPSESPVSFTVSFTEAWLPFSTAIMLGSSKATGLEMRRHSRSSTKRWSLITGATTRNIALKRVMSARRACAPSGGELQVHEVGGDAFVRRLVVDAAEQPEAVPFREIHQALRVEPEGDAAPVVA